MTTQETDSRIFQNRLFQQCFGSVLRKRQHKAEISCQPAEIDASELYSISEGLGNPDRNPLLDELSGQTDAAEDFQ